MKVVKFLFVAMLLVVAAVGFFVMMPYGPDSETFVEIAPGTSTAEIAARLTGSGIVRSALVFEVMKKLKHGTLKAGEYRFDHPATVSEVYDRLRRGDVYTVAVVVPEGFNIFDIAQAVQTAGLGTSADFLAAERQHTELIAQWSPGAKSLEGYLFPDTYKFGRHATPAQMVTAMVKRFGQVAKSLGLGHATLVPTTQYRPYWERLGVGHVDVVLPSEKRDVGHTPFAGDVTEMVTMASLVEREVHVDAERPVVAGVFENRLAAGMRLQTDPTVMYASLLRGTWTGVIHKSELESDSAYNTYTHGGLPPGPICSPGVAALRAAMHPAKTGYLYFVANANGTTKFATTMAEHEANVAVYRAGK